MKTTPDSSMFPVHIPPPYIFLYFYYLYFSVKLQGQGDESLDSDTDLKFGYPTNEEVYKIKY